MRNGWFPAAILVIAAILPAADAVAQGLTLRDAVAQALRQNPQIAASKSDSDAARARRLEARSSWLPRIDATASSTRSNNPVFVFGSLLEQGRFGPQHFDPAFLNDPKPLRNDRLALNVRYAIFDQLRRYDATRQAGEAVTRSDRAADETRQRVIAEVVSRFYGLTVALQKETVAGEAVKTAESATTATANRVEQGLGVRSDLLAAQVQLGQMRQQLIEATGDVAIARAALAVTLQRPIDVPIEVSAEIPSGPLPEIDLPAALERAAGSRGEVLAAEAAVRAAELQIRTTRGSFLPRLDAYATVGASGPTFNDRNYDRTAGLLASIDIFDGGKVARLAEARAGLEGARAIRTMMRDKVVMETVSAHHRLRTAQQKVEVAASAAEQAAEASRIVADRYENGLTTITEQLRAQTAAVAARLGLLAARYEYVTGYAELLRATGGLHDVDLFD